MRVYALLVAAAVVAAPVFSSSLLTVELDYSTVQAVGGNTTVGYYKYQNIRFAAVPTGDLRFAAPELPPQENETNTGTNLADADVDCSSTEDCLYLDVWAPANATNLPVMVWTYGGGFSAGSKSQNTPEGLFDLSQDFVFVAYNYRLGITGLGNGPTYQHEGGAANLVVWDSTRAFEWVKTYIGEFGGNPNDVTAVGFSAGGSQVMFQMTRFGGNAPQLFEKAYIMSPGYVPGAGHHHAEQFWQNVSTAVGCDGGHLDCMREVDFSTLQDAASEVVSDYTYQYQPRVDGFIIPDTYEASLYQGLFNFSGRTYTLSTSSSTSRRAQATDSASSYYANVSAGSAAMGSTPGSSIGGIGSFTDMGGGVMGAGGESSVNSTIAIMMQKYLLSFVITGNPNVMWPDDKIYWPQYNESSVGTEIIFNDTFSVADDDLANSKSLFWNKALWY
ncbi:hypothetical protein PR003_g11899 [Phytophthora rubi]|uniref:Carboxylesterase type B domain-containing protein n=1 Tax=Phytophthora rubi TaxID=129364 RepID=A0A6A4F6S2_9STRA|nr:hypothetical protein PR003_g11899 [Phytophthora rubi]